MRHRKRAALILAAFAWCLFFEAPCAVADEAVRADGSRVAGTLRSNADGRLDFIAKDTKRDLRLADVQHIRFPNVSAPRGRWIAPLHFQLANNQVVTGELLALDQSAVRIRTFWAECVRLERRDVLAITQL